MIIFNNIIQLSPGLRIRWEQNEDHSLFFCLVPHLTKISRLSFPVIDFAAQRPGQTHPASSSSAAESTKVCDVRGGMNKEETWQCAKQTSNWLASHNIRSML